MKGIFIAIAFLTILVTPVVSQSGKVNHTPSNQARVMFSEVYLYNSSTDSFPEQNKKHFKIKEWIEIYNGSNDRIKTRYLFLTDDVSIPEKWMIVAIKQKDKLISPKEILTVYLRGSNKGKKAFARTDWDIDNGDLYLVYKNGRFGEFTLLDTLSFPTNKTYPYSRYPEGGDFIHSDVLSPEKENMIQSESHSKRVRGVTVHSGLSTMRSESLKGIADPRVAFSFGTFKRRSFGLVALETGIRFSLRGYHFNTNVVTSTSKGVRTLSTKGRQAVWYLDLPFIANYHLNRKWTGLFGPIISFKLASSIKYEQVNRFNFYTGVEEVTVTHYKNTEPNDAIDYLDVSLLFGVRYNYNKWANFSLYYMRDFGGDNSSTFAGPLQTTSGLFVTVDAPLRFSYKRKKNHFILKDK